MSAGYETASNTRRYGNPVVGTGPVCVVGSCMMDLVLRAPRRPRSGETVLGMPYDPAMPPR